MKLKLTISLLCAGLSLSPLTWAGFPSAGVDNVPSLAQFKVTFTKTFAVYLRDNKGLPFCVGYTLANCPPSAREYTSPMLYEPNTKVGRSSPFKDGDGTDEEWGADVCKEGTSSSCSQFFSASGDDPIVDGHFQWKTGGYQEDGAPFDEGPKDREEIHTQVASFQITPLQNDGSANAVRAGEKAPCQARSLGEVESLNGNGFPAESFFHMYVDVDVDINKDGRPDMVLFNKAGRENTILGGDPLIIEATNLTSFPPKVIYSHTGRTGDKVAPKLYIGLPNRAKAGEKNAHDCGMDPNPAFYENGEPTHVGWIRVATHGIDFQPRIGIDVWGGFREGGAKDSQCLAGESDIECFERFFNSLPMLPIPKDEDTPPSPGNLVELGYAMAVAVDNKVAIGWATLSEIQNAGFLIWRARKANDGEPVEYVLSNGTLLTDIKQITPELIPTRGVLHNGITYSHIDSEVASGNTYYYAIGDVNFGGEITIHLAHIASAIVN